MKKIVSTLALSATLASATYAQIISEQFSNGVANGASLIGQAGVTGNNWAWSTGSGSFTFSSTSLIYNLGGGQALEHSGGSAIVGAQGGLPQQAVTFDNAGVQYFSFVFQHLNPATVSGGRIRIEAFGGSSEGYGINYNFNATTGNMDIFGLAGATSATGVQLTGATATAPILIVGKFDPAASTNGSTTIWINPTSFTDESSMIGSLGTGRTSTVAATGAVVRDDGILFRTTISPTGNWFQVDDIRVADDFAGLDLVAVPEPSAFAALAGLGALGFAASRRRRA
jgi:hypothetical protein